MRGGYRGTLGEAIKQARHMLKEYGRDVPVSRWQAVETEGHFLELTNHSFSAPVPATVDELQAECQPNLPWADLHFKERVTGPMNPGESYKVWPFWRQGEADETMRRLDGKFSHTYMERMWPKFVNRTYAGYVEPTRGIRFNYGDLSDVVKMLANDPYTRQAYLPIWFPEDTGAVHGERVPCTIGYHFMMRDGMLSAWYFIRSCDIVHYFQDDVYLACRLLLWVLEQAQYEEAATMDTHGDQGPGIWEHVKPGFLHMTIASLHVFRGDFHVLRTP